MKIPRFTRIVRGPMVDKHMDVDVHPNGWLWTESVVGGTLIQMLAGEPVMVKEQQDVVRDALENALNESASATDS